MACSTIANVAIGATFACDDALEQPLQLLLREALNGSDRRVDVQWLPYGSTAQLSIWASSLLRGGGGGGHASVDLVVLLIRMSDLEAAHPELAASVSTSSSSRSSSSSPILGQLVTNLALYEATEQLPPLMLIVTPSPPEQELRYLNAEREFLQRVGGNRDLPSKIQWRSSTQVLELFQSHNGPHSVFYDHKSDQLKHAPYTQRMLNALGLELCRQICRLFRSKAQKKKVIVLDCDNTLWGGAVAEVGVQGIVLTDGFLSLQRFVVKQQQQGMLLCLCSKNVERDVVNVFEQRKGDMVLQLQEHVALAKVNWQDKSANIEAIAKELSLGLDSFVFVDDNPVECSEVASKLPMVTVINVPSAATAQGFTSGFLDREWVFDEPIQSASHAVEGTTTSEDVQRTQLYRQNLQRNRLLEGSGSHKAFLSSLGVKIVFEDVQVPSKDVDITEQTTTDSDDAVTIAVLSPSFARVLQLHGRTNQFNIATSFSRALTHDKLASYAPRASPPSEASISSVGAFCAHVTDRFGHYGLVSVILYRLVDVDPPSASASSSRHLLHVDSFLLSCRALNRGVEHAMVRKVAEIAETLGAQTIEFSWEPTDRNEPARLFFASLSDFAFKPHKHSGSGEQQRQQRQQQQQQQRHQVVTPRDEKLRWSAKSKGKWTIDTCKAAHVAFLKVEKEDELKQGEDAKPKELLHQSSIVWWVTIPAGFYRLVTKFARMFQSILVKIAARMLPKWLVSFIGAHLRPLSCTTIQPQQCHSIPTDQLSLQLCQSFRELASLNAFIKKHTTLLLEEQGETAHLSSGDERVGTAVNGDAVLDEREASKFRRKARHQTKLALLSHLNEENPTVIWSANRKVLGSDNDDNANDGAIGVIGQQGVHDADTAGDSSDTLILQQHLPCSTPQCEATIQKQSLCSFQRCRTCCYKIQRLTMRLEINSHAKARQTAIDALAQQFNVVIDAAAVPASANEDGLCPAHQNARRRQ